MESRLKSRILWAFGCDWAVGADVLRLRRPVGTEKLVPLSGSTSPIIEKDSETRRRAVAIGGDSRNWRKALGNLKSEI